MTLEEYLDRLGENLALHNFHYKKFQVSPQQVREIRAIKPFNILVLTEPWCGDSLAIFPVVGKIAETNGSWTIKVLLRDQNLDLMDQFLTRGGRAIPIFLFLDEGYTPLFNWGPRPKVVQQIFEDHRQQIQNGEIKRERVIKKIRKFYSQDRGQEILKDLLHTIKEKI